MTFIFGFYVYFVRIGCRIVGDKKSKYRNKRKRSSKGQVCISFVSIILNILLNTMFLFYLFVATINVNFCKFANSFIEDHQFRAKILPQNLTKLTNIALNSYGKSLDMIVERGHLDKFRQLGYILEAFNKKFLLNPLTDAAGVEISMGITPEQYLSMLNNAKIDP